MKFKVFLFFFSLIFAFYSSSFESFKVLERPDGSKSIDWPYLDYSVSFEPHEAFRFNTYLKLLSQLSNALQLSLNEPEDPYESIPLHSIFFQKYFHLRELEKKEDFKLNNLAVIVPLIIKFSQEKSKWSSVKFFNFLRNCFGKIYYTLDDIEFVFNNYKVHEIENLCDKLKNSTNKMAHYNQAKNPQLEYKHAIKLANNYCKLNSPKDLLYALAIYNYAYHLSSLCEEKNLVTKKIASVTKQLFYKFNVNLDEDYIISKIHKNKEQIQSIRSELNKGIDSLDHSASLDEILGLKNEISRVFEEYVRSLLQDSEQFLGIPPCEYSVIAFGSLSNGLFSPYSDLEYSILVSKNTPEVQDYFQKFAYIFHTQITNLGETLLTAFSRHFLKQTKFADVVTPRGFTFDGRAPSQNRGGVTPFGDNRFNLIRTPKQLVNIQKDSYFLQNEPTVSFELMTGGKHIFGDKKLSDKYHQVLNQFLNKDNDLGEVKRDLVFKHWFFFFADLRDLDLSNFALDQAQSFNIKSVLFTYPMIMVQFLSIHNQVEGDVYQKIDKLSSKNILDSLSASLLKKAIADAFLLKLKIYRCFNEARNYACFHSVSSDEQKSEIFRQPYVLSERDVSIFRSSFTLFDDFYRKIGSYVNSKKPINLIPEEKAYALNSGKDLEKCPKELLDRFGKLLKKIASDIYIISITEKSKHYGNQLEISKTRLNNLIDVLQGLGYSNSEIHVVDAVTPIDIIGDKWEDFINLYKNGEFFNRFDWPVVIDKMFGEAKDVYWRRAWGWVKPVPGTNKFLREPKNQLGSVAVTYSHVKALKTINNSLNEISGNVAVFEDDVNFIFSDEILDKLEKAYDELQKIDWDTFKLGMTCIKEKETNFQLCYHKTDELTSSVGSFGAVAQIFNKDKVLQIIHCHELYYSNPDRLEVFLPIDWYRSVMERLGLFKTYVINPPIVGQSTKYSIRCEVNRENHFTDPMLLRTGLFCRYPDLNDLKLRSDCMMGYQYKGCKVLKKYIPIN